MDFPIPEAPASLLRRLNDAGYEAFLVGGCVRDLLRGETPQDWDICTSARPEQTRACFAGERVIETGLKHGTVTVLVGGQPFEITTYRVDGTYSDGRRPDRVDFVSDLTQDLARRDFTMNAMALGLDGALRDPFGGAEDIRRKLIRCVGEPERRFREDGLRLMRCLRFAADLGYAVEEETGAALVRCREMLRNVAAERIQTELRKLLMGAGCVEVLRRWPELFWEFWPELKALKGMPQNSPYHCWDGWEHTLHALSAAPPDLAVRLAVLLHDVGKPPCRSTDEAGVDHFYGHESVGAELADGMLRRLKFDNATRERVVTLVARHCLWFPPEERNIRRWLGRLGEETFFQLLEVKRCDGRGQPEEVSLPRRGELDALETKARAILAQGECLTLKGLAVKGSDALAAGIPKGPAVGEALNALLEQVLDGSLPNDREVLLEKLAERAGR